MATSTEAPRTPAAPRAVGGRRWAPAVAWLHRTPAVVAAAALAVLAVSWPLLTGFADPPWDWWPHLWYSWHQGGAIKAGGLPSLFAHDDTSVFDAHFAFYGGTLYAIAGALSVVSGITIAYTSMHLLAFGAALGGFFWLARMAGLGRWWSLVPGTLFISSPYVLALTYARGGWPELTAVCVMPLLVASALSVLRAPRLQAWPAVALAVSGVVFFGSHNITLLWGGTVVALTAALVVCFVAPARRLVTRAGVLRLAAVLVPAALVNAWFLVPDVVYQSHTYVGARPGDWEHTLHAFSVLVSGDRLFSLGRGTANVAVPSFALQLPLLAFAWVLAAVVVVRSRLSSSWGRITVALSAMTVALVVVMTHVGLITALPEPFAFIQFSFRIESYILLGAAGAVLAALVLVRGAAAPARRRWAWAIVPVVAVSLVQAAGQAHMVRDAQSNRPTWESDPGYLTGDAVPGAEDYVGWDLPKMTVGGAAPRIAFPARDAERSGHTTVVADAQPGELLATNASALPELVKLEGARFAGVDQTLHNVIQVDRGATPGAARITLGAAHPWPVVAGRILSLMGLLGFALLAAAMLRRRRAD
ncbi:MAG: hypothetical protein JWR63_4611 [Conexibacter sp.]|nr:hypothetical protein [Conexibacter sp.]